MITRFDMDMDGSMEPAEQGRWVRWDTIAAPQPAGAAIADNFEAECRDGDALLCALGLDPVAYRTAGGRLNLPRIKAALPTPRTVAAMAERAEIGPEELQALPRRLLDVACRIRASETLHRDDELVDKAAHAIRGALLAEAQPAGAAEQPKDKP